MRKSHLTWLASLCCFTTCLTLHAQPDEGWFSLSPGLSAMDDLEFINDNVGCVVGRTDSLAVGITHDGGTTWQVHTLGPSAGHARVHMRDADHVWVMADGAESYFTLDGGATWSAVPSPLALDASGAGDVAFPADDAVYLGALDDGVLVKSTDLGMSWDTVLTAAPASAFGKIDLLAFANAESGLYCPDYQNVLFTTDGGASWDTLIHSASWTDFNGIRCWDTQHCMTFLDWAFQEIDLSTMMVTLHGTNRLDCFWDFVNADMGFGGGATPAGTTWSVGNFYHTTDGGMSRSAVGFSYTDMYNGPVDFTSALVGYRLMDVAIGAPTYCSGPYGQLLKTTVGAVSAAVPQVPPPPVLHPNPAQGKVTLQATVPLGDAPRILQDLNGRAIPIACRRISPMAWEIDLTGVAPGIYFLQVEQGGLRQTTKLVVQ